MALTEYLRPLIMAGGFAFILVGMSILIAEQPTYASELTSLYTLILWTFYLYILFLFISILVGALDALLKIRAAKGMN